MIGSPSPFEWATFTIAVIGALTALLSLGWQILAHYFTGSRVRVKIEGGLLAGGSPSAPEVEAFLGVSATNRGRTDIDVRTWGFLLPTDERLMFAQWDDFVGPRTPVRLKHGQSQTWRPTAAMVRAGLSDNDVATDIELRGYVILGTGKVCKSRNRYAVPDHG